MSSKKQNHLMLRMMPRMLGMIGGWEQRAVQVPESHKALPDAPVPGDF